jgi:cytidylate kinase
MKKNLVIAIDGPSASGKGTLAKRIAAHFGLPYLNTGALYRLVAWRVMERKIDPSDFENQILNLVKNISESDLELEELFSEKVGAVASLLAKNIKLRVALFDFQRDFAKSEKGAVLDGRDTTTVICSDADYKFFVTADVEIRARRRHNQLQEVPYEEILAQLKKRDENDFNREDAPLKIAADAVVIDNGNLSIEEGFQKILQIINS